ncbi:hypothetical protein H2203_001289 [Taxawa tesnikishii (nom. ined.)]|nr:hypothetical protein H2203_001289 [Dothideales sp. JES 119]
MDSINKTQLPSIRTLLARTPDASPQTLKVQEEEYSPRMTAREVDPQLFPSENKLRHSEAMQRPEPEQTPSISDIISTHMARQARTLPPLPQPKEDEYQLIADVVMVSRVLKKVARDPKAWANRELEYLSAMKTSTTTHAQTSKATRKTTTTKTTKTSAPKRRRVAKDPLAPKPERVQRKARSEHDSLSPVFMDAIAHTKPSKPAPSKDTTLYTEIPDYCPPISTLGDNPRALKVTWPSQPLDLSADPDRHLLHESEIYVASALRLTCQAYLRAKRRLFQARFQSYCNGKEFRKTTAQQACKIDVNKASSLWSAFEKVGWFDPEWMEQYL